MDRTQVGWREFGQATDGRGPVATGRVASASPVLADGVGEFIFADVFSRPGLSARERELVTVAVLAALGGAEPQLGVHVPAALQCGVDSDELVALCEQITPYAGFPRALNALRAVRAVMDEQQLPPPLVGARVRLGDHETVVSDSGPVDGGGMPLVFVHPIGLCRNLWRDVVRAIGGRRRTIAYDLRGHGGAAGEPPGGDPLQTASADLVALLNWAGIEGPVELVGVGDGALVAGELSGTLPQAVGALTQVSAGLETGTVGVQRLTRWLTPVALAEDGPLVRYLRDRLRRPADPAQDALRQAVAAAAGAGHRPARVRGVEGAEGPGAAAAVPGSVHVISGSGAMVPVEAPGALADMLVQPFTD